MYKETKKTEKSFITFIRKVFISFYKKSFINFLNLKAILSLLRSIVSINFSVFRGKHARYIKSRKGGRNNRGMNLFVGSGKSFFIDAVAQGKQASTQNFNEGTLIVFTRTSVVQPPLRENAPNELPVESWEGNLAVE